MNQNYRAGEEELSQASILLWRMSYITISFKIFVRFALRGLKLNITFSFWIFCYLIAMFSLLFMTIYVLSRVGKWIDEVFTDLLRKDERFLRMFFRFFMDCLT